jgi:CRP/FNR family transcriptional regulator
VITEIQSDRLLALYPVLLDLPASLLQELEAEGKPVKMSAGHVLFDIGTPCTDFLMVITGSLRVIKIGASGREMLLYRVQPGQVCLLTLSCLLDNTAYVAKGIAETDVAAIAISRALFLRMLDHSSFFRLFVLRYLTERMVGFISLIEEIVFERLDQRIAALLLSKGTRIKTTHQTLADELGSTREAVSRALENLEEQRLVVLERGRITILDRAALEKVERNAR